MGSKTKKETKRNETVDPFTQNMINTAASNARAFGEQAYTPYTGERVAGMSDMETEALSNYMSNNVSNRGIMEQGLEMAQQGAQYTPDQIQTQNFTDMDISGYMNPYIQQVIDNTVSDIERKQMGSAENIDAQAAKSAAFGGSRQAIQQAENEVRDRPDRARPAQDDGVGVQRGRHADGSTRDDECGTSRRRDGVDATRETTTRRAKHSPSSRRARRRRTRAERRAERAREI